MNDTLNFKAKFKAENEAYREELRRKVQRLYYENYVGQVGAKGFYLNHERGVPVAQIIVHYNVNTKHIWYYCENEQPDTGHWSLDSSNAQFFQYCSFEDSLAWSKYFSRNEPTCPFKVKELSKERQPLDVFVLPETILLDKQALEKLVFNCLFCIYPQ